MSNNAGLPDSGVPSVAVFDSRPDGAGVAAPVLSVGNNDNAGDAMEGVTTDKVDTRDRETMVMDYLEAQFPQKKRVHLLPGAEDTAASYQVDFEDHTLGNALRWMIMKNPQVELCGYTMPHPAEEKMHLRIQTYEGTTAREALDKGLDDLMNLCDAVMDKFLAARTAHGRDGE